MPVLDHIVYPMAAMVLLTATVLVNMFRRRVGAVKAGEVKASFYKTFQGENTEPRVTAQISRHYVNLFEAPVLFYVACLTAMVTGLDGRTMIVLAWLFVIARVAHALIHIGANKIQPRIAAYLFGWLVLVAMWGLIVYGVAVPR